MVIGRREFVKAGAAAVVAGLGLGACGEAGAYPASALSRPELLSVLGPDAVREIGLRYREAVPAEARPESLRDAILAARPWSARLPWRADPPLAELVREDFAAGRTLRLAGWVVSVTEARQCALFSLLDS